MLVETDRQAYGHVYATAWVTVCASEESGLYAGKHRQTWRPCLSYLSAYPPLPTTRTKNRVALGGTWTKTPVPLTLSKPSTVVQVAQSVELSTR